MNKKRILLVGLCLITCSAGALARQDGQWGWTLGFDYSEGDYGNPQETEILYVPLTARYDTGRWTFRATLPWVSIEGPGGVVPELGNVQGRTGKARREESGIGDGVGSATYNLSPGGGPAPIIDLTGKVKLPTASESRGLGTGEVDLAGQVDFYKPIAPDTTGLLTLGYTILGDPPGVTLRNVFYGSFGAVYQIDEAVSIGASFDFRQRVIAGGEPQRELLGFVGYRRDRYWRVQGYVVQGLSDGSPDWGVGAVAIREY
ncbi:MAG TPA: hypothetical protein VNM24_02940 [Burkholderiales bacterium]|jgi:hypothetical protein|nr:hypothetical protein [Burkholderiales bacterium]